MKSIIKIKNLSKTYSTSKKKVEVLKGVNVEFEPGKFYVIMGHSGSGKSTLINIIGLIDSFDSGEYYLFDKNIINMSDKELSNFRMKNIGFVFQNFCLNHTLKAYENVIVPMLINKEIPAKERKKRALDLLEIFGLENRANHFPREMSGGEQQRVAIARSLANDPQVILADEPTGNLDEKTEKEIFNYLKELAKGGKCVIVVSHTNEVKTYADKVYELKDGELVSYDE